jgi:thiol-disulfide isomerase/thioredoxin
LHLSWQTGSDINHRCLQGNSGFCTSNQSYMKIVFFSAALLLLLGACADSTSVTAQGPDPAQAITETKAIVADTLLNNATPATPSALPSFRMRNGRGEIVDMAQFKGKKVFVNLWATWCPPCRAEIPSIESLGAKTDPAKVEFVMLSLDDNFEKAKNYAANNNMRLPVYYPASDLPQLFVTEGIPMTVIFNEKGEILFNEVGSANYDTKRFQDLLK